MCNCNIRTAGRERAFYGFDEWTETRINTVLGSAVIEVFPKSFAPVIRQSARGTLEWAKMRLSGHRAQGAPAGTNIRDITDFWRQCDRRGMCA